MNVLVVVIIAAVIVRIVDSISLLLLFEPLHHCAVLLDTLLLRCLVRVERLADLVGVLVQRAAWDLQLGLALLADDRQILVDRRFWRFRNLDRLDLFWRNARVSRRQLFFLDRHDLLSYRVRVGHGAAGKRFLLPAQRSDLLVVVQPQVEASLSLLENALNLG